MYKLKQIPEDFIVDEVNNALKLGEGQYSTYRLTKKQYNTGDAIKALSDKLKVPIKFFNYAGTKDRQAITSQYITISNGPKENFEIKDIKLEYLGQRKERLNLGDLEGNRFTITIRDIEDKPKQISFIPNYFDSQRFGNESNNHAVGKLLIQGEFKKALELIDDPRKEQYGNNPIGYFQSLQKKIAMIYIHSYQSYLFNKMVSETIKDETLEYETYETEFNDLIFTKTELKNRKIPLIGFGTEETDEVQRTLEEEDLTTRDFIIRKIPFLSSEGDERDMLTEVKDMVIGEIETDELNEGKKKCKVEFMLGKGSYATIVIKAMMI